MIHPNFLGKKAPVIEARTLRVNKYFSLARLPPIPDERDWSTAVPNWHMLANDRMGNCAVAGPAHSLMGWNYNAGRIFEPLEADVISDYQNISGYNGSPQSDTGCVISDVMRYWRKRGICGKRIGAYALLDTLNSTQQFSGYDHTLLCTAIELFGSLGVGLALPKGAMNEPFWDAPSNFHRYGPWAPYSWGGHYVIIIGYTRRTLKIVTWGKTMEMSYNFMDRYADETWITLTKEAFNGQLKTPNGFDMPALANAFHVVTST